LYETKKEDLKILRNKNLILVKKIENFRKISKLEIFKNKKHKNVKIKKNVEKSIILAFKFKSKHAFISQKSLPSFQL